MRSIVLAIGVILLVMCIIAIDNNMGLEDNAPQAIAGTLDLRSVTYEAMKPVQLHGQWDFYYGSIDHTSISAFSSVEVPSSWTEKGFDASGTAVYRLRMLLPGAGTYSMLIDNIYTAYRLYIDGKFYFEVGEVSSEQETSRAFFTDSIATFVTEDSTVDIIFEVSNYYHRTAGMAVAPIVGHPADIVRMLTMSHLISMILVGIFVTTALFILYFYHSSNRDPSLIYFAILCIVLATRAMASNSLLAILIPNIPIWLVSKIEYAAIGIAISLLALYSRHAFPKVLHKTMEDILVGISLAYSLVVIVSPLHTYNHLFVPYMVFFAIMLSYWIISMTVMFLKKNAIPITVLMGSWVCVIAILIEAVYYYFEIPNLFVINMAPIGVAFFIITHFHEFSLKFIEALTISKQASHVLEQEVAQRTQQLQQLNTQLSQIAKTDALTGLYNHHQLYQMTASEAKNFNDAAQEGSSHYYAVAYIDLDNFKYFNDMFTHKAGDVVLARFAAQLASSLEAPATPFRAGGDEFIVFLPGYDYLACEHWAHMFLTSLHTFSEVLEHTLSEQLNIQVTIPEDHALNCSIGIAVHEEGPLDIEALIQLADSALHEAKKIGKGCFHLEIELK